MKQPSPTIAVEKIENRFDSLSKRMDNFIEVLDNVCLVIFNSPLWIKTLHKSE